MADHVPQHMIMILVARYHIPTRDELICAVERHAADGKRLSVRDASELDAVADTNSFGRPERHGTNQ